MNSSRLKVLVADIAALDARVREILPGDDLTFVRTSCEAEKTLGGLSFDLVVICQRFDDSRALELLRAIMDDRCLGATPVACIRAPDAVRRSSAPDGFERGVTGMGAKAVVDLRFWPSRQRLEDDRVRRIFYGCIDRRTMILKTNAYTRALSFACDTVGGRERLAGLLGVSPAELSRWMAGAEIPPFEMYSRALDLVAAGPYAAARPAGARSRRDEAPGA